MPQVKSPEEALEDAYLQFRAALEAELLEAVTSASPAFFEELVVDLLVRMGYGGSRPDAAWAVGRTGDGGIDGVIDEDRLSLDVIYVQVKRWQGTVGRPEIQKFAGALQVSGRRRASASQRRRLPDWAAVETFYVDLLCALAEAK